uniref:Polycomb protein esc n=1 Tax=Anopheles culicifacies TaxID=139723 RepID=A0A182M9F5_9DIPT
MKLARKEEAANNTQGDVSDEEDDDIHETSSMGSTCTDNTSNGSESQINRKKRKRSKKKSAKVMKPIFKFSCYVKEDHGQSLFGCLFNYNLKNGELPTFATVGSNRVTIYQCENDGKITLKQCYADPDTEEVFYTCAWSHDVETGNPLLAAGGLRGVLRVFNTASLEGHKYYIGHGHAINEVKFHPKEPYLLMSASKDHSLRLWNTKTDICIAVFGGVEGHRDEVLSFDFDIQGKRIMSCGMDHSLKMWRLDTDTMKKAIQNSYTFNEAKNLSRFPSVNEHFPVFSTRDIHRNYVDCVRWMGDFVLSKSCQNTIVCWKPGRLEDVEVKNNETNTTVITTLEYSECIIWFVRFSLDYWQKYLALGNQTGRIYIWELDTDDPVHPRCSTLFHPKCTTPIRQTAFSRSGNILICVCDDGTVWRWDKINNN